MSATTYEEWIDDGWLALAAAIMSPKELSVNESLRLIGVKTPDEKNDGYDKENDNRIRRKEKTP